MEMILAIVMIIMGWMLTSACFMLKYRVTGEETRIERFMIGIVCFPWLICFVIGGLFTAFVEICEKKIKSENDK